MRAVTLKIVERRVFKFISHATFLCCDFYVLYENRTLAPWIMVLPVPSLSP